MPIRFVDRSVLIGLMQSTLADSTASIAGTHVLPAGRTGTIAARLADHASQVMGAFIANPNRIGTFVSILDNATAALQGSSQSDFTAPTVPGALTVAVLGDTSLQPSWGSSSDTGGSGLAGYKLERSADGATAWTQIYQNTAQTFIDTGLPVGTTQFYRVRSYDVAGNSSGYSTIASAKTTGVAQGGFYNPDYPRFGSYALGGTANSTNAALAATHVNIISYWPGWENSRGTLQSKVNAVKAASTIGSKIIPYTLSTDAFDSWGTAPQANWEVYNKLTANQWFVYTNGLTHTGKIQGSQSDQSKPNYTTSCPPVAGDIASKWKARWDYKLLYTGGVFSDGVNNQNVTATPALDGRYEDNIYARERSAGDYNVDGVSEAVSSAANISLINSSHASSCAYWRSLAPANSFLLANSTDWPVWYPAGLAGQPLDQQYDGGLMENIDEWVNGFRGSTATSLLNAIKVQVDAYRGAKLGVLEIQLPSATSYDVMRYWHCIAGLTGTYLYLHLTSGYLAEELGSVVYDEKTFALGPAIDPPQWTPRYQAGANGIGIYRRDCVNGIYLWAAPGATYSSVNLGGIFYRLVGTHDPVTNNGAPVTSVTLAAGTGLVLSNTPTAFSASISGGILQLDVGAGIARVAPRWGRPATNTDTSNLHDLKTFRIFAGTTPGASNLIAGLDLSTTAQRLATECRITGLAVGGACYVRVRTIDSAGNESADSAEFAGTAAVYVPATRANSAVPGGNNITSAGEYRIAASGATGPITISASNVYLTGFNDDGVTKRTLTHGSGVHGIVLASGVTNVWIDGIAFSHASGTGSNIRLPSSIGTGCFFSRNNFVCRQNAGLDGNGGNGCNINGARIFGNTCLNTYPVASPDEGVSMVAYCTNFLAYDNTCTMSSVAHRSGMFGMCGVYEAWANTFTTTGTCLQAFFHSAYGLSAFSAPISAFIHDNAISNGANSTTQRLINLDGKLESPPTTINQCLHKVLWNTFTVTQAGSDGPCIRVRNPVGPVDIAFNTFVNVNSTVTAVSMGDSSNGGDPVNLCPFGGYFYHNTCTGFGTGRPLLFYGGNGWGQTLFSWNNVWGGESSGGDGAWTMNQDSLANGIQKTSGATWRAFNSTIGGSTAGVTIVGAWDGYNPVSDTPNAPATPVAVTGVA
jgi:hypothetical protein